MFHFMSITKADKDPLSEVLKRAVPYLFAKSQYIPMWAVIPIYCLRITASFIWIYVDVFIQVISIGLSTQFQLFNGELLETQPVVEHFFLTKMRNH